MDALTQLKAALTERYEIEREIGAGGMATVYLARDVRHDRLVALKLLNPELGAVLGVERFLAEIKVTANLQHPNLLPLFDSGEAGGLLFYVMPFVEGESLRVRLEREKQLPIDEAIRIAVAVANALDYAHGHGVIHRDLKPENILLQAGQPVVADFGIALAVSKAGGNRITQTGLSLGTPQYMSPEQATGDRVIDGRSDIYSLAAVTYEMLTGEPPHTGSTAQAIIARVLTDKPRGIRSSRSAVSEHVEAALEHALEKLPADRFSTAREFAEAIQGRGAAVAPKSAAARAAAARARGPIGWRARVRDPLTLALAVVALGAAATALALSRRAPAAVQMKPIRFVIAAPDSARPFDNFPWPAAVSPDGGTVVFSVARRTGGGMLYALRTDQLEAHPIPGTAGADQPLFSPDGQWVEFEAAGKQKKVRLDGSAPITITDAASANGADWTTGDEIVLGAVGKFHGLARVSAAGGELTEVTRVDSSKGESDHLWPIALPDGKTVVFAIWSGTLAGSRLGIASLRDGKVTALDVKGIRPLAVLDGNLIYVQADGAVMAIPLDASGRRVKGKSVPVHDPVTVVAGLNGNSGIFVSRGGALVTSRGGDLSQLTWVNRDGTTRPVSPEIRGFYFPRLSPDGRRIAVTAGDAQKTDIWIYDTVTGTLSRLSSAESAYGAAWTADGERVVYAAVGQDGKTVIVSQLADGGSPAEKIVGPPDVPAGVEISPDGRWVLFPAYHNNSWDVFRASLDSSGVVRPFLGTPASELGPRFSPDGRWVALTTGEAGQAEVFVRSFPNPESRVQISAGGGSEPVWSADGTRIYYRAGTRLMAAKLSLTPEVRVLARDTVLAQADAFGQPIGIRANYDVTRDGARFLALSSDRHDFQLVVVPNWLHELRERLKASGGK